MVGRNELPARIVVGDTSPTACQPDSSNKQDQQASEPSTAELPDTQACSLPQRNASPPAVDLKSQRLPDAGGAQDLIPAYREVTNGREDGRSSTTQNVSQNDADICCKMLRLSVDLATDQSLDQVQQCGPRFQEGWVLDPLSSPNMEPFIKALLSPSWGGQLKADDSCQECPQLLPKLWQATHEPATGPSSDAKLLPTYLQPGNMSVDVDQLIPDMEPDCNRAAWDNYDITVSPGGTEHLIPAWLPALA